MGFLYSAKVDGVIRGPNRDKGTPSGAKALCGRPLISPVDRARCVDRRGLLYKNCWHSE
jgi:hypothetical protein